MSRIIYKVHQVSQLTNKTLRLVSTPQTVGALSLVSELINPFKMSSPVAYGCKVVVDVVKEYGKLSMMNGAN